MNTFKVSLFLIGMLFSVQSFSQIKIGAKAGLNLSNVMFDIDSDYGDEPETKTKVGYQIGLTADISLVENTLSLQPSLLFANKGLSVDVEKTYEDFFNDIDDYEGYLRLNYNYIEMPINVAYKIKGFQLVAGPYLAFGVGGNLKHDFSFEADGVDYDSDDIYDEDSYKLKPVFGKVDDDDYDDFIDDDDLIDLYRAFDLGLNLGVGYQIDNILINAGYSFGFVNMTPNYDADDYDLDEDYTEGTVLKNRVFTLSVSYFFN